MSDVTVFDAGRRKVARRVTVHAPATELFALLADPRRHHEIDGSGTVRARVRGPERLSEGAKFSVVMKQYGVPYAITSTVTVFTEASVIEWRHPVGHRWRWEFDEVSPGVTTVTETFDYSTTPMAPVFEVLGQTTKNTRGITQTLDGLAARYPA